jgi:hypothetical protein
MAAGLEDRRRSDSQPERDGRGEMDGAEEVGCELVVAGCDAAEVLQSAEHALGGIAIPVAHFLFGSYSKTAPAFLNLWSRVGQWPLPHCATSFSNKLNTTTLTLDRAKRKVCEALAGGSETPALITAG